MPSQEHAPCATRAACKSPPNAVEAAEHAHLKLRLASCAASMVRPSRLSYQRPPPGSVTCRHARRAARVSMVTCMKCSPAGSTACSSHSSEEMQGVGWSQVATAAEPALGWAATTHGTARSSMNLKGVCTWTSVASLSRTGATSSEGPADVGYRVCNGAQCVQCAWAAGLLHCAPCKRARTRQSRTPGTAAHPTRLCLPLPASPSMNECCTAAAAGSAGNS